MTTAKERAEKSARNALAKGLTGMVLGVASMLMFFSPSDRYTFIAACLVALGAAIFTAASIIAVRRTGAGSSSS